MRHARSGHDPLPDASGGNPDAAGVAVFSLLEAAATAPANDLQSIVDVAGDLLGASSARLLVADYSLSSMRYLTTQPEDEHDELTEVRGTLAGLAFSRAETMRSGEHVYVPVSEDSERLGLLELVHPNWSQDQDQLLDAVVRVLTLVLVSKRRYTDALLRARRAEPLSLAAELQWDLLPPLSCSTAEVSVSGLLQPAYSIGGDSFDFALNRDVLELAIIDAVGHGMPAVLISTVGINGLRNARREGRGLEAAYLDTGSAIETEFGHGAFATGQIGSLDLPSGDLTWLNAGHPLPLLIRNGSYMGELPCRPSLPMGLSGTVSEVAVAHLQAGDRVLFYTDGVTETRSADGDEFGLPRLVDLLVRAANEHTTCVETLRSLSTAIMAYRANDLTDDATLVMIEFHGS